MGEFGFSVVTSSKVTVSAGEGREARSMLERALDGCAARVLTGPGSGLELVEVRLASPPGLVSVDGLDPLSRIEEALRAYRDASEDPDAGP